jgi:hypothetical protein|tara:strand:+ start:340 stop:597 length:258 start_codon:yes stop_codon:yes gene_type:complete
MVVLNKRRDTIPREAVYVGRGSKWGNPFIIGKDGNREEVIAKYIAYAKAKFSREELRVLKGKDLVCYCAPLKCHGDVLSRVSEVA